ncbi:MAG: DUF4149 domain-containing protein [Pseudomonadota bacterium]
MTSVALLLAAAVFGGMILFSSTFAPLVFRYLEADAARMMIRLAFPWYYWFVISGSAVSATALIFVNTISAQIMLLVTLLGAVAAFILMPRINASRDAGEGKAKQFKRLHALSFSINLVQIVAIGWVLIRLLNTDRLFLT